MRMNKIVKSMCTLMLTGAILVGSTAEAFLAEELPEEVSGEFALEQSQDEISAEPAAEANEEAAEPAVLIEADAQDASFEYEEDASALDPADLEDPTDPADPEDAAQEEEIVYDDLEDVITEDLIWSEDEMEEEALPVADGTEEEFRAADGEDVCAEEEELPAEQLEETAEEPGPQEAAAPTEGECGSGKWVLSGGTLTITANPGGNGKIIYGFKTLQNSEEANAVTSVTKIVIEDGVKEIGYHTFINFKKVTSVVLPTNTLVRIGTGAFAQCESLSTIVLPGTLTTIEDAAFTGCKALTEITFPNSLKSLGTYKEKAKYTYQENKEEYLYVGAGTEDTSVEKSGVFSGCSSLKKAVLPAQLTSVGGDLFQGCTKLETVTMKGVQSLPLGKFGFFSYCTALKSVDAPALKTVGRRAFQNCTSLEKTEFASLETIEMEGFQNCSALKSFHGYFSLKNVGRYAFSGCSSLETVELSYSKVEVLDAYAFNNCTSLKTISLPKTLVTLREYVFFNCQSLKSLDLKTVASIWKQAVYKCSALESITLSDYLSYLESNAFQDNKAAKTVTYDGSEEDFKSIKNIDSNTDLLSGTIKYLKKNDTRPKLSDLEPTILSTKNTDDFKDAAFNVLQARMKTRGKTSIKLTWEKVEGAEGYVIYGALRKKAYERLAYVEETKSSYKIKGLKANKYYKYIVVAYANSGHARRVRRIVSVSSVIIAATKGGKYRNTDSVTIKEAPKQTLKAKKKLKLTVTEVSKPQNGKKYMTYRKLTLESSDPAVVKILKNGKIKALKKGKCYIYAYSQNGVFAKIQIKVKAA